jgi:hypothetical protein
MDASDGSTAAALRRLIVGYRLSLALHVAAKLGLADLLADGPRSVEELARAAGAHPPSLYRVLRLLASEGVFAETDPRRFELTPLAAPLRRDAPGSVWARAVFDGEEWNWRAWGQLLQGSRMRNQELSGMGGLKTAHPRRRSEEPPFPNRNASLPSGLSY